MGRPARNAYKSTSPPDRVKKTPPEIMGGMREVDRKAKGNGLYTYNDPINAAETRKSKT